MAAANASARERRVTAARPGLLTTGPPDLRVVKPSTRQRSSIRAMVVLAVCIVLGSMLAVVGAQAALVEGQVRLANLQTGIAAQTMQQRSLELQVAQLENPSRIVSQAEQQGLTVPTQVVDLPPVNLAGPPATAPKPASGSSPTTSATASASSGAK